MSGMLFQLPAACQQEVLHSPLHPVYHFEGVQHISKGWIRGSYLTHTEVTTFQRVRSVYKDGHIQTWPLECN